MRPVDSRRSVLIFVGFTAAFSSVFYFLIAKSGHSGGALVNYVGSLMWCPGLAALVTCKYLGRDLSTLGWNWGKARYKIACYLFPLAYGAASYAFVWLTGFGGFYNKQFLDIGDRERPQVLSYLHIGFVGTHASTHGQLMSARAGVHRRHKHEDRWTGLS